MASVSTTTAATWLDNVYSPEVSLQAYDKMIFAKRIKEYEAGHKLLHIPKHANLSRSTISSNFSSLTFVSNTESEVQLTPSILGIPVEIDINVLTRDFFDSEQVIAKSIAMSLAEGIDAACLTDVSSITTSIVGDGAANLDKPLFADAVQKLATNAKSYFEPGVSDASFIIPAQSVDDLLSITDFTSAAVRGDSSNPLVEGWVWRAFGVNVYESTQVQVIGTTAYGVMFVPQAFGISYNQRPKVLHQEYQLVKRVIGYADYLHGAVREELAVQVKLPST